MQLSRYYIYDWRWLGLCHLPLFARSLALLSLNTIDRLKYHMGEDVYTISPQQAFGDCWPWCAVTIRTSSLFQFIGLTAWMWLGYKGSNFGPLQPHCASFNHSFIMVVHGIFDDNVLYESTLTVVRRINEIFTTIYCLVSWPIMDHKQFGLFGSLYVVK